jgi:hypothetical protein
MKLNRASKTYRSLLSILTYNGSIIKRRAKEQEEKIFEKIIFKIPKFEENSSFNIHPRTSAKSM